MVRRCEAGGTLSPAFIFQVLFPEFRQFYHIASKIRFNLKIDAFGDDIYMKMNARGLQFKSMAVAVVNRRGCCVCFL